MKDKIKNILDITFWKFVLVGIVNTLVGTAVMFAAYNVLHLSYWISSACNTFLDAYGCNKIQITTDGQEIVTGHAEYPGYNGKFE